MCNAATNGTQASLASSGIGILAKAVISGPIMLNRLNSSILLIRHVVVAVISKKKFFCVPI